MSVSSGALTTRQRLKDFLDISADDTTTNNVLDRIIDACSDWVESYCRRTFKRTTYTNEMYDGNDSQYLLLRNYPIDTTQSFVLEMRTSSLDEDDWESIDSEEYFVHSEEGYINFPRAEYGKGGRKFIIGTQNYRVDYTAGYYLPGDANYSQGASNSLPLDLEMAVWKLCAAAWNSRRGDASVQSERLGSYSVTFAKESFEDERILDILNKYARIDELSYRS